MILLRTPRLVIRNWEERDRDLFHRINSDDRVMEYFPFRRTRSQADALMDEMRADIAADGYGWTAAEIVETGQCIGFVGISPAEIEPIVPPGSTEIGWRLAPEFWGHGFVTEAASALLDHAFGPLGMEEIISFAVATNERSISVMRRLGMTRDMGYDFDHPEVTDTHPHLKRFVLYRLKRGDWLKR